MRCRSAWCWPIPPGARRVENVAARSYHGHAAVLVEEAVERQVRRAIRGYRRGAERRVHRPAADGPGSRRPCPLEDGGALVTIDDVSERARLDAVRTDFVANISHELKTPVGALAVLAEALADIDDPTAARRLADKMVDEAHRAARTIDDLLELSRTELGGAAARDLVRLPQVDRRRRRRGLKPRPSSTPSQSASSKDPRRPPRRRQPSAAGLRGRQPRSRTRSSTAMPARRSSSSRVSVDGWIEIVVTDTGVGIPPRDIDRIFERFYRVDRARSRDTGGTGLGLSIVRHVATNHRGEVTVQSREGEGSVFTIRMPTGDS